ncbi:GNAT family N-acetyltransferase [Hydrogenimonas urashimensis]|uniref:GNAT family N-acetyltransferase n=1 Tax=Hydrogenimonas urashimensis TaxID=2740515 RepID=UPI00191535A6|nr:GNAT family N-acetyltransferase [Hydrogenimonas urashimensis]
MPLRRQGSSRKRHIAFFIEKLSPANIREAESLRDKTFPNPDNGEEQLLRASLEAVKYSNVLLRNDVETLSYRVAKDQSSFNVIGLTGLYTEIGDDPDNCWLGWFCVQERFRGFGIGKKLLDFSIEMAGKMGKKWLHVYTYDSNTFRPAINLYRKHGFEMYNESKAGGNRIYLKRKIDKGDFKRTNEIT